VAAAGTSKGLQRIRAHRVGPTVRVGYVVPTVFDAGDAKTRKHWKTLIKAYGPSKKGNKSRFGFQNSGALVAFNYQIPNNTPLLLHEDSAKWHALFTGPAPQNLRSVFGFQSAEERIERAAATVGVNLAPDLPASDARMVLTLSTICGRWREGEEEAIAEVTGLTVPEVIIVRHQARKGGLLTRDGRLTDTGHQTLKSGTLSERKRPDIPTSAEPYYPKSLRVPRVTSRVRRPSGRPR
jgi:hypothetical protein